jgi:hypothetical protein
MAFRCPDRVMTTPQNDCCRASCLVHAGGLGITGRVVHAFARWTVIEDEHGRRAAVPTGSCEPVQPGCSGGRCPFAADLAA